MNAIIDDFCQTYLTYLQKCYHWCYCWNAGVIFLLSSQEFFGNLNSSFQQNYYPNFNFKMKQTASVRLSNASGFG